MDKIKEVLETYNVKTVFSQNAKMKKSSQNGIHLYNWGIPAFRSKDGTFTCPNARHCVAGCYAKSGAYLWSTVAQAYENRLSLTYDRHFVDVMVYHIDKLLKRHKTGLILIRVHDSGDFYSHVYQSTWYDIARHYITNDRIKFYAYTKMVSQSESLKPFEPDNFRLIYSLGGSEDELINRINMRHSRVFNTETELEQAGYVNASHDDNLALGPNPKIGLVYHGTKNYTNTTWSKVKA